MVAVTGLFHAHSGLRYLVLLAGVIASVYFLIGLTTKRPYGKATRVLGSIYVGFVDLQILLGLVLLMMRPFYPRLWGHLAMMVLAAVVAHVLLVVNRKRAQPNHVLPLIAVGASLLLIVGGILAIRPSVFAMSMGGG